MQNKANFLKGKINAKFFATKDYENESLRRPLGKQTQSKPISIPKKPLIVYNHQRIQKIATKTRSHKEKGIELKRNLVVEASLLVSKLVSKLEAGHWKLDKKRASSFQNEHRYEHRQH